MENGSNNVKKEYFVEFNMHYSKDKKLSPRYKTINAILLNDYPSNMVFENEDGMYKMSIDAISIMFPTGKIIK